MFLCSFLKYRLIVFVWGIVAMVFTRAFHARNYKSYSQFCHVNQRRSARSKLFHQVCHFSPFLKLPFLFCIKKGYQIVEQYSRWIVLGWALTFRLICKPLKRVFPTLVSLENAGNVYY